MSSVFVPGPRIFWRAGELGPQIATGGTPAAPSYGGFNWATHPVAYTLVLVFAVILGARAFGVID